MDESLVEHLCGDWMLMSKAVGILDADNCQQIQFNERRHMISVESPPRFFSPLVHPDRVPFHMRPLRWHASPQRLFTMHIHVAAQGIQRCSRHDNPNKQTKVTKTELKARSDVLGPLQGFIPRPTLSMMGQPREGGGGPPTPFPTPPEALRALFGHWPIPSSTSPLGLYKNPQPLDLLIPFFSLQASKQESS